MSLGLEILLMDMMAGPIGRYQMSLTVLSPVQTNYTQRDWETCEDILRCRLTNT
jgi:hypothetical protein